MALGTVMWTVSRHGGSENHRWRIVYEGCDGKKAHEIYKRMKARLCRGGLRLWRGNYVERSIWGPE